MLIDAVKEKIREIARERGSAERSLKKAAALAKRWTRKRKAKGPDLIGEAIRRRERDLAETLKRMKDAEDAWNRALKMLDDYTYEVDEMPAWMKAAQHGGFTGDVFTPASFKFL